MLCSFHYYNDSMLLFSTNFISREVSICRESTNASWKSAYLYHQGRGSKVFFIPKITLKIHYQKIQLLFKFSYKQKIHHGGRKGYVGEFFLLREYIKALKTNKQTNIRYPNQTHWWIIYILWARNESAARKRHLSQNL